jgi:hypothetical protein
MMAVVLVVLTKIKNGGDGNDVCFCFVLFVCLFVCLFVFSWVSA